jgi:endonuclease/exonuclease/phosphatase family metal-dependent hydrolase
MKILLLLLFTLGSLTAQAGEAVRVLTFNLRYLNSGDKGDKAWTARRDLAVELIKKDAPDFLGTQEAFRVMLDDVKARVPGYAEIGVGREDGKTKGEYSAILYREAAWELKDSGTFWLSDTPEVVASSSWGNKVTRICTWGKFRRKADGKEVLVYNTHLDHESQPAREKGAALIMKRIAARGSEGPVIFTGDFNAAPDNAAIATVQKGPPALTDAWLSLHKDAKPAESGTFHGFSGKRDGGHIDYIFTTAEFVATESAILNEAQDGKWPSDHYPVRATLTLKP